MLPAPTTTAHPRRHDKLTACALMYQRQPARRDEALVELLRFARSLARRYKRGEEPLDDLVQVASVGLVKALDRYDPSVGRPFAAFAVPTITGELRRHYRDTGWAVHVPRSVQELSQRLKGVERELFAKLDRHPTLQEISAALGVDEEKILEARIAGNGMRSSSLDVPASDDERAPIDRLGGVIEPGYALVEDRATVGAATADLPERDRRMLALRFGAEKSQKEIGETLGISQMHVSRELRRIQDVVRRSTEDTSGTRDAA